MSKFYFCMIRNIEWKIIGLIFRKMELSTGLVVKIAWVIVSLLSFIYLFIISQQLGDLYYPIFVSPIPKNLFSCALLFFIISVASSILIYYRFFLSDDPISILINISSSFLFCFCTLSFIICYGTKLYFDKSDAQVYQNAIVSCQVDSFICDQFKQTIGDISMSKSELKKLVTEYVNERTIKASSNSLLIMTFWIIMHSIYLNYLLNDHEEEKVEVYDKPQTNEGINLDDISKMNDVEKEEFSS